MLQNQEFIQEFVEEARIHIEQVESDLLELAGSGEDHELVNRLFRSMHSIKGTAGFFGLSNIVKLSHSMESLFGDVRNGNIQLDDPSIEALLRANDTLRDMVNDVMNSHLIDISPHINEFNLLSKKKTAPVRSETLVAIQGENTEKVVIGANHHERLEEAIKHGHRLYKIQLRLYKDLDARGVSPVAFFNNIQSIGQVLESHSDFSKIRNLDDVLDKDIEYIFLFTTVLEKNLVALALDIPEESIYELDIETKPEEYRKILMEEGLSKDELPAAVLSEDRDKVTAKKDIPSLNLEDSIRVPIGLLNDLMNLASELVLGRNQLLRGLENYRRDVEGLEPILQNIDHITTQLQERVMQTRMQPLGNVFNKFPRIIRDLSRQLKKEIRLETEGTQVELDKSIIESLADPLTHLIRNAADHGIELPEERERMGKEREGIISIAAFQEGGHVSILVSDDGAGIDIESIKAKILEKELKTQQELSIMDEREILEHIFSPGFSMASRVTDVSGRGVGMDVVRTNIEKIGGTIEIDSQVGKGTIFKLNLPLTLAIISSLIVEAGGQKFALPQVNLQEMVRVRPGDRDRRIEYVKNSLVLRFRGSLLPIVALAEVLGLESEALDQERLGDFSKIIRILVLKVGQKRFGLIVDAIHDDEEILVKPLPRHLKDCRCYSGVTILGDGGIAMILDTDGIASQAELKFSENEGDSRDIVDTKDVDREQHTMLLFSCSGTEILGLHLSLVSRVEEIRPADIQMIGDMEYIEFRGTPLRLIRPEDFIPISRREYSRQKLYVIVPKLVKHPIGILIGKIHDTAILDVDFSRQDIKAHGIIGTTFWNKKIVLLLNLYQLFEKAAPEYYKTSEPSRSEAKKYTVLLVEDAPFFRRLERGYLEEAGYKVLEAENGAQALDIIRRERVDAIISDINMPVMDGLELIERIRKDEKFSHLPAIAVTSLDGENQMRAGIEAGFDFYERKLDKEMLLNKLLAAIKKKEARP